MDRSVSADLEFPAASVQLSVPATVAVLVPIYDRVFVPVARDLTGEPSGITMLQRIGTGLFLSFLSMAVAAVVEMKRLKNAQQYGLLVDTPGVTIPMSFWWLIPQNVLLGAAVSSASEAFSAAFLSPSLREQPAAMATIAGFPIT
ncbi:hypothetical protein OIU85_004439 [Salix viminalis]|uniref:Uncharacterized protein n=1 Tax=Salix viminalis TaxID=40686 RepID=A0A9Q0PSQ5_SALVM|nr:hypothetical protein OIU85_004439 [Salix viminalis]